MTDVLERLHAQRCGVQWPQPAGVEAAQSWGSGRASWGDTGELSDLDTWRCPGWEGMALQVGEQMCEGTKVGVGGVSRTPAWQGLQCQGQGLGLLLGQWEPRRALRRGRAWKGARDQLGAWAGAQRRGSHCCAGSGGAYGGGGEEGGSGHGRRDLQGESLGQHRPSELRALTRERA